MRKSKWNKNLIIRKIKELDNKTFGYVDKNYPKLLYAAERYFGSWEKAIVLCGFDYTKIRRTKKWTKCEVLKETKLLNDNSHNNVKRNYSSLYEAGIFRFGSWKATVKAAGCVYNTKNTRWTAEKVIKDIKNIKKIKNLRPRIIELYNISLLAAGERYFGSWKNAVDAAGIDYDKIKCYNSAVESYLFDVIKNILPGKTHQNYNGFEWLKYKRKMHLDMYNEKLNVAIEYQGRQHYEPVRFGSASYEEAKVELEKQIVRDKIKKKLLKKNGIKLIEVKYTEKITEELVLNKLKKAGINV